MGVASNIKDLKRRVDDYLWRDQSMPLKELRAIFSQHFSKLGQVSIIGGLVRDVARNGASNFRSDIDLVIDAPKEDISHWAKTVGARPNRFGGYAVRYSQWKVDFWALSETWAHKSGHVNVNSLDDLTKCTFFDWDAVVYDIATKSIHCRSDYLEIIRGGTIEINLEANPSLEGNLLRAVRRLLLWNIDSGPRLRSFILENLDDVQLHYIRTKEAQLYANPVVWHIKDLAHLRHQIESVANRLELDTSFSEQLLLPGITHTIWGARQKQIRTKNQLKIRTNQH
jgi:hypothetical protein